MEKRSVVFVLMALVLIFTGCDFNDDDDDKREVLKSDFTLQLLHFADIDGDEDAALNNIKNFSALVNGLKNDPEYGKSTLVVSSGDNIIPGARFYAAEQKAIKDITGSDEPGHADIAFLNQLGVAASALGNHELDAGPAEFADAVKADNTSQQAKFPFLCANIDFSKESDFGEGKDVEIGIDGDLDVFLGGKVAKCAITEVNGETIGLVGASTPDLPYITNTGSLEVSPSGSSWTINELAAVIQKTVDTLTNKGVDKIILLAHMQQISIEKELAGLLKNVDIIVAGGSNTLLADDNDKLFPTDSAKDTYPLKLTSPNGDPVLVVNVDGDYKYLGRLVVPFDENGKILVDSLDSNLNGPLASTDENVSAFGGTPDNELTEIRDALKQVIIEQYGNVIGYTKVFLDGRRLNVRTQETNLGNLSAAANLWYANLLSDENVDISIKNGGGLRTEIGTAVVPPGETDPSKVVLLPPQASTENKTSAGAVTEGHLRATLRFDNGLCCLSITALELKDVMEHSFAATEDGATPGQFPQIAGMRVVYDINGTPRTAKDTGSRVKELVILDDDLKDKDIVVQNGAIVGDPLRTFRLVTLNFLANGGDSYPFETLSSPKRTNLYEGMAYGETIDYPDETLANDPGKNNSFSHTGGEQDALAEYFLEKYPTIDKGYDKAETSIENDEFIKPYNP